MNQNPLLKLSDLGQSIWLDYTRRDFTESGDLRRLIERDDLRGMTSNPAIFEQAIARTELYDADISAMTGAGKNPQQIYEQLSVSDIQAAADEFRPVFDKHRGGDGMVSLEVNPHLARDTEGTLKEARHLWQALERPNVFIKVPATKEGLAAIRQLTCEGINVNVTLLFGLPRYREVVEAYLSGLEERVKQGQPIDTIVSVASFFLSRIDSLVDPKLESIAAAGDSHAELAKAAHGEVALASAKVAYEIYQDLFTNERFKKLAAHGARPQRLLWASTSTKNPDYDDLKYVDSLIGQETINTVTRETLDAYRDHGDPASRLEANRQHSHTILGHLTTLGMHLDPLTQQLEDEGVEKFNQAFDQLIAALKEKSAASS